MSGALGPDATPLEIRTAVVDAIEEHVVPIGRGKRVFPFDQVAVQVFVRAASEKPRLEATFATLEEKLCERLDEIGCRLPRPAVTVAFVENAPSHWPTGQLFSVDCQRAAAAGEQGTRHDDEAPSASAPLLRVDVLKGTATEKVYTLREPTIFIGRTPEVRQPSGRSRRNQIAFDENNGTVSRAHARLKFDPDRGRYHLLDEGSIHGTTIVRRGETIQVPPRDPRGVLLQSGDEIQLGDAAIRIGFNPQPTSL